MYTDEDVRSRNRDGNGKNVRFRNVSSFTEVSSHLFLRWGMFAMMKLPRIRWRLFGAVFLALTSGAAASAGLWWHRRYEIATEMLLPVREYVAAEYPHEPGERSGDMRHYSG